MLSQAKTAFTRTQQLSHQFIQTRALSTAMASHTTIKLNTGAQCPALGFGTWQDQGHMEDAVAEAIKVGYRHIDTARIYGTEPAVGKGVKKSGVPRSELFITTKLWNNDHDHVEEALDASLKDLQMDYVDLFLMHWPVAFKHGGKPMPKDGNGKIITIERSYVDTWKDMEKCFKSGKAKAIGLANFSKAEVENILKQGSVVPAMHQMELHPYLQQSDFVAWNKKQGIQVTAYSPFGNLNPIYDKAKNETPSIKDSTIVSIAEKHGKKPSQTILAWGITSGHIVIPKSKTLDRVRENFGGDFRLDEEDMKKIKGLDRQARYCDSSDSFGYKFFADLEGHS